MKLDFKEDRSIIIRANANKWGPYNFNFPACSGPSTNDGVIPYGTTLSTCIVRSYLASKSIKITESTDVLLASGSTVVSGNTVSINIQYIDTAPPTAGLHCLEFEITLSTGAMDTKRFGYVQVE